MSCLHGRSSEFGRADRSPMWRERPNIRSRNQIDPGFVHAQTGFVRIDIQIPRQISGIRGASELSEKGVRRALGPTCDGRVASIRRRARERVRGYTWGCTASAC